MVSDFDMKNWIDRKKVVVTFYAAWQTGFPDMTSMAAVCTFGAGNNI